MIFIWGRRSEVVYVAPASAVQCPICRQSTKHLYWLAYTYFHVYYLFGTVVKRTYRLVCDRCKNGTAVSLDNVPWEVRAHQPIPFMQRNGLWTALGLFLVGPVVLMIPIALVRVAFEKQGKPVAARPEVKPQEPKPAVPAAAPPIQVALRPAPPVQVAPQVPPTPPAKVAAQDASGDVLDKVQPTRPAEPVRPAAPNRPERSEPRARPQRRAKPSPAPQGETTVLGGGRDQQYRDIAPPGGLLVGFDVGLGKFGKNDVVRAARPIYRVGDQESSGQQFGTELDRVVTAKAKPGYAVGAITVKAGLTADGFSVTFMRIDGDHLDPTDAYESDWLGGQGGAPPKRLGGDGRYVHGIIAKQNKKNQCTGLGLLYDPSNVRPGE